MAYWTFMQFVSFSFSFKTDKEKQYEVTQITSELRKTFILCEGVYKTSQGFVLLNDQEKKEVWVENDRLIYGSEIHQLPMNLLEYRTMYNKQPVQNNGLVDEIIITGIFARDTLTLLFKKEYFASTLLNEDY